MGSPNNAVERLTKADYELLAAFRYALRKFVGFSENAAIANGVSPQQYQTLLAIEGFPGRNWVTIGELAEQMRIAHHSAVGMVDRMEGLGLLKRASSEQDRRRSAGLAYEKRPLYTGKALSNSSRRTSFRWTAIGCVTPKSGVRAPE